MTVITGDVGAGKTTLLHHLLNQHHEDNIVVGLLSNTQRDSGTQLMKWVSMAFALKHTHDKVTLLNNFQRFLIDNYSQGKKSVLIVDEAQNLTTKALEELRLLNNINANQDELLKIVLVGQPELLDQLTRPELSQFAQRVTLEFHLEALNAEETGRYIKHRLQVAGCTQEIFDQDGIYTIYYLSGGVPRLINSLCDFTLLYGYSGGKTRLSAGEILEVVKGRRIGVINKQARRTEDMEHARELIEKKTGIDLFEWVNGRYSGA